MSFNESIKQTYIGDLIELWDIDATALGGSFLRLSPHIFAQTEWRGNFYTPFPIEFSIAEKAIDRAPPRGTLRVSKVNRTVFLQALQYGDLIGANVTRWRTLTKYLDGQPEEDPNAHFPIEQYEIIQKSVFSLERIEFVLASVFDTPNIKIPKRQILRDDVPGNLFSPSIGLPGLSRR